MKIKVIGEFIDKTNKRITYEVGDVVDFPEERAMNLINRGLAESEASTEDVAPKVIQKRGRKKPSTDED